jgi:hypothetical protein
MRVAPVGLFYQKESEPFSVFWTLFREHNLELPKVL